LTGPFLVADSFGVIDEAKNQGVQLTFLEAGGFGGLQKQISNTENLIERKVDALLLDPISDDAIKPIIDRAIDAKIPVIGVGDALSHPGVTASVTSSHTEIGTAMANAVVDEFKGQQANLVVLGGPPGAEWTTKREEAFMDVVGKQSNFKVLTTQWFPDETRANGLKLAEDFMKTFPDANLFYTADNAVGLGVADAVKAQGKAGQVKIVTCVIDADTVAMIRDGIITIDVAQQPVLIGRMAVQTALQVLRGESVPRVTNVPVITITKANIDQVKTETMMAPEGWKP
jgi:ABC-type sugar transport system substrate-binding protein